MVRNCGDTSACGNDAIEGTGESSNSTVTDKTQRNGSVGVKLRKRGWHKSQRHTSEERAGPFGWTQGNRVRPLNVPSSS